MCAWTDASVHCEDAKHDARVRVTVQHIINSYLHKTDWIPLEMKVVIAAGQ